MTTTSRRSKTSAAFNRATQVAETMTAQEQTANSIPSMVTTVPIAQIQVPNQRTRLLNDQHVLELKDSIAAVGLGQPLITDQSYRLLAGGHRLAAIQKLQQEQPKIFQQQFPGQAIPVRVYAFDAITDPERALQIEIIENEKRRDYTPAEVRALAEQYIDQGYSLAARRPKGGEKPLIPALQTYFRLSRRTIQRYLTNEPELSASPDTLTPKARKIKGYIKSLQGLREFLKQENQKGVRSIDHLLEQLDAMLR